MLAGKPAADPIRSSRAGASNVASRQASHGGGSTPLPRKQRRGHSKGSIEPLPPSGEGLRWGPPAADPSPPAPLA